jgi:uncharacterized cupin superfamily protein
MEDEYSPVARLAELPREAFSQGVQYQSLDSDLSGRLRLTALGAVYTEVPPGKSACPFHVHHAEDELFIILEGQGDYRFGDVSYPVAAGDVLGAPRGGSEFAHKLINSGSVPLRYLAISSRAALDVCEYPDSGKFLVRSGVAKQDSQRFVYIGRAEDTLDYWDGEAGS